jgi:hypothetical protein
MANTAKKTPRFITRDNDHVEEGVLCVIYNTEQKTDKFSTRKFVIDTSYQYQDYYYEQYAIFQLVNNRCDLIDFHKVGDRVKVHFNIRGTGGRDQQQRPIVFTNLDAYRIEKVVADVPVPVDNSNLQEWLREPIVKGNGWEGVDDLPF